MANPRFLQACLLVLCLLVAADGATLTVTKLKAWGLKGDPVGKTDAFVKVWYGSNFGGVTGVIKEEDNPEWGSAFQFTGVSAGSILKLEVWDQDVQNDDLQGICTTKVTSGTRTESCRLYRGTLSYTYSI